MSAYYFTCHNLGVYAAPAEITCSCFPQLLGVSIEVFILLVQLLCLVTSKIIDYLVLAFFFTFLPLRHDHTSSLFLVTQRKILQRFSIHRTHLQWTYWNKQDPDCRISVESALAHPYLATYSDSDDEVRFSKTDTTTEQSLELIFILLLW